LPEHLQVRIKKTELSFPNIFVKFGAVHAGSIDACLGIIVPADLIAFVAENLMIDIAGSKSSCAFGMKQRE